MRYVDGFGKPQTATLTNLHHADGDLRFPGLKYESPEKARRHQLRNELADLIAQGRMSQNSIFLAGKRLLSKDQAAELFSRVAAWHMAVLQFTEKKISHADAMRLMAPATSGTYPPGIADPILFDEGKTGVPLMQSWDFLASDLAALEGFLAERPEL